MSGADDVRPQRRGRRLAMSKDERDGFLATERTCRVATTGADGAPYVAPLWFVWDGTALWLNSIVSSRRWADVTRRPRVSVVVDAGDRFAELRGVELRGRAEIVGEVPRSSDPDPVLAPVEEMFGRKYADGTFVADGHHAWLRVCPEAVATWDFRKMGS